MNEFNETLNKASSFFQRTNNQISNPIPNGTLNQFSTNTNNISTNSNGFSTTMNNNFFGIGNQGFNNNLNGNNTNSSTMRNTSDLFLEDSFSINNNNNQFQQTKNKTPIIISNSKKRKKDDFDLDLDDNSNNGFIILNNNNQTNMLNVSQTTSQSSGQQLQQLQQLQQIQIQQPSSLNFSQPSNKQQKIGEQQQQQTFSSFQPAPSVVQQPIQPQPQPQTNPLSNFFSKPNAIPQQQSQQQFIPKQIPQPTVPQTQILQQPQIPLQQPIPQSPQPKSQIPILPKPLPPPPKPQQDNNNFQSPSTTPTNGPVFSNVNLAQKQVEIASKLSSFAAPPPRQLSSQSSSQQPQPQPPQQQQIQQPQQQSLPPPQQLPPPAQIFKPTTTTNKSVPAIEITSSQLDRLVSAPQPQPQLQRRKLPPQFMNSENNNQSTTTITTNPDNSIKNNRNPIEPKELLQQPQPQPQSNQPAPASNHSPNESENERWSASQFLQTQSMANFAQNNNKKMIPGPIGSLSKAELGGMGGGREIAPLQRNNLNRQPQPIQKQNHNQPQQQHQSKQMQQHQQQQHQNQEDDEEKQQQALEIPDVDPIVQNQNQNQNINTTTTANNNNNQNNNPQTTPTEGPRLLGIDRRTIEDDDSAAIPKEADFRKLPWLTMLKKHDYLPSLRSAAVEDLGKPQQPASNKKLVCSVSQILEGQYSKRVEELIVLLKTLKPSDLDAEATFGDPTGKIKGTIHKSVLEKHPEIITGSVLYVRKVPLLHATRKTWFLVVTPDNLVDFVPKNVKNNGLVPKEYGDHRKFISWADLYENITFKSSQRKVANVVSVGGNEADGDENENNQPPVHFNLSNNEDLQMP